MTDFDPTRRTFLAAAGASIASMLGCLERQPPEDIVPYVSTPEYVVPGRPLWFASAMLVGGYAYGTLVESHTGRPTKIEGHPDHPSSLGATDAWGQALIRDFVDDSRTRSVLHHGVPGSFADVCAGVRGLERVAILSGRVTSPTTARVIEALTSTRPGFQWFCWEPISERDALAGAREAFGRELHAVPRLDRARVVVSLDDDLFADRPGRLAHARAFALGRAPSLAPGEAMRLYVAESFPTITGAVADYREALRHDQVAELAEALLAAVRGQLDSDGTSFVERAAADLRAVGSRGLVLAGLRQPPRVHAIAHAINHLLGSAGETIEHYEPFARGPVAGLESLLELAAAIRLGHVDALILLDDVNPVYDGPPELELDRLLRRVPLVIHHGLRRSESAAVADWHVPAAHPLESWADARGHDGTPTLLQPLIRPLFDGRTAAELLTALFDRPLSSQELVRATWREHAPSDADWRRAVHDGRLQNGLRPVSTRVRPDLLEAVSFSAVERSELLLAFRPDPCLHDGRFAANPWLQELPKPISTIAWGNAAFVAPATASARGLEDGQLVRLGVEGRSVTLPIFTLAGHPRDQVTVHLGHGRRFAALPGIGVDVYPLRVATWPWARPGLVLEPLTEHAPVIVVQHNHQLEGYAIVREASRTAYLDRGAAVFAAPHDRLRPPSLHPDRPIVSPSWAMTIDLNACIGCNACVLACQAENNIATVGPEQVRMGREMHWIRVDAYALDDGRTMFQPVPCMQCEHAPCEVVCPTGATVHSVSGLNDMVYNRCVGTRYCNNNCPYKVRRFNFFHYSQWRGLSRLTYNPDVTVRERGVMEKCTYCVQRIHAGQRAARRADRELRDGDIRTACQQACPTRAIEFGDLGDPDAAVVAAKAEPRNYVLLGDLGTRPRTSYLGRLRNLEGESS